MSVRRGGSSRWQSGAVAAAGAMLLCGMLAVSMLSAVGPSLLLDKEAAEIAQLKAEKRQLEHSLRTGRAPLLHPLALKAEVRRVAALKANVEKGKQWALKSAPPAAPVQTLSQVAAPQPVQQLEAQRALLEKQIDVYKKQAVQQKDPLMGGLLAAYKTDTGAGVLSRTSTMQADSQGLLGRVRDDDSVNDNDNVLGSLAATMTKEQQQKMLQAEHLRQLHNEAKAMGDVSPKEALAQRIIALGAQFLSEKDEPHHTDVKAGPTSTADAAVRHHARGRVAKLHTRLAVAQEAKHGDAPFKSHEEAVSAAKKRVELLRQELKEAERVAKLQAEMQRAQSKLADTHAKEAMLHERGMAHRQNLVAKAPGDDEGANEKFDHANVEIHKFVGTQMDSIEDDDAEDEADPTMENRFNKKSHGEGYIKKAIYVGTPEAGPDRYGQDGAGPQIIKGKLGDNIVDVGLMGAAGTLEG